MLYVSGKLKSCKFNLSVAMSAVLAAALMSSCRAPLAEQGTTQSPYIREAARKKHLAELAPVYGQNGGTNAGTGGNNGGTSGSHSGAPTTPPPSTAPTSRPNASDSLTLLDTDNLSKQEHEAPDFHDPRWTLNVKFNSAIYLPGLQEIPGSESDAGDGCRSIRIQAPTNGNQWSAQKPSGSVFSCAILYCTNPMAKEVSDEPMRLDIKAGEVYQFKRFTNNLDTTQHEHVRLYRTTGGTSAGMIMALTCDGEGGSLAVNDLINAFGQDSGKKDVVEVTIDKNPNNGAPLSPGTAPAYQPGNPAATLPQYQRGYLGQWRQQGGRSPASDDNTSVATSPYETSNDPSHVRPNYGIQFNGSPRAFGSGVISPAQENVKSAGFMLAFEYQPSQFQKYGVVSIGPSIGLFPTSGINGYTGQKVTASLLSVYETGAQLRYQFHYVNNQLIVPFTSFNFQSIHYSFADGGSGRVNATGGSAGVALLINRLAPAEAWNFYRSVGVSRTYLTAEIQNLSGSDSNVNISGNSFYLGLRTEF